MTMFTPKSHICPHCQTGFVSFIKKNGILFCPHCQHSILAHPPFVLNPNDNIIKQFVKFSLYRLYRIRFIFLLILPAYFAINDYYWAYWAFGISFLVFMLGIILAIFYKPWRQYCDYLEYKDFILKKGVDKLDDLKNCHYDFVIPQFNDPNQVICPHCTSQRLVDGNHLSDMPQYKTTKDKRGVLCLACQNTLIPYKTSVRVLQIIALVLFVNFIDDIGKNFFNYMVYLSIYMAFMLLLQFIRHKTPLWKL